jgi:DNA-directed RNA polymerase subunit K/omega
LKDIVRQLEGEKKADLKLLEMSKEKYQLASKEFRRTLQLDESGQLFGEDGQRHRLVDSKFERVQQNFGLLSNKVRSLIYAIRKGNSLHYSLTIILVKRQWNL